MASPNVAGVAAEVLANYPDLTPIEELKEILMESSYQTPVYASKIKSGGRVDLERALRATFLINNHYISWPIL